MTLYEEIGGEPALMVAVAMFYEKVLADDRVNRFFSGLEMGSQTKKQVAFMTHALCGESKYKGKALGPAHAKLVREQGLDGSHFEVISSLLGETLTELGI